MSKRKLGGAAIRPTGGKRASGKLPASAARKPAASKPGNKTAGRQRR